MGQLLPQGDARTARETFAREPTDAATLAIARRHRPPLLGTKVTCGAPEVALNSSSASNQEVLLGSPRAPRATSRIDSGRAPRARSLWTPEHFGTSGTEPCSESMARSAIHAVAGLNRPKHFIQKFFLSV